MTANPSIQANFQTQFIDGLDLIPRLMHKAFEDRRAGYQPGRFAGGVDPHEVPRRPVDTPRGGVSQGLYAPTQSYQPPQTSAGGQYTREGGPGPELGRSQLLAGPIQTTRQPVTGASPSRRFRREKIIDENQRWPEAAWFKPDGGEVERQTSVQQLQRKMTLPNSKNFHKFVHDARSKYDLDRTGKITYREFYSTLNQYTEGVSPQEFQNLVKAYDKEGSGYVQYERLAADLAGLQGESKAQNFHAERVRDQIIRGNGGGFNPLQVRQVLDTVDSRRTGQLDEVQATAALRNMGLAVSNRDASSFLRSVATTHPGSGRYSVEKLAQAISDMAAGQDLRHVKNEKMSKILAAPEPASTESLITIGNEAGTEVRLIANSWYFLFAFVLQLFLSPLSLFVKELRPRRVDLEDGRTRKEKLVWSKMMGRLKSEKDRVYSQLRATAAGSRDGTLSVSIDNSLTNVLNRPMYHCSPILFCFATLAEKKAAEIRDVLRISNTDSTMLFSAAGSRGDRVPVSQVIQLIDAQGTGAVKKLEAGEIFYRRPPEQEKPRGPIKTCNPRGTFARGECKLHRFFFCRVVHLCICGRLRASQGQRFCLTRTTSTAPRKVFSDLVPKRTAGRTTTLRYAVQIL